MKTSNKILLFIGLALLISPFINAYSLKQKIDNKEYTLINLQNKSESEFIDISPTDSIHIIGGKGLVVEIIQSDSVSVEKIKSSKVLLSKENDALIVQYSKEQRTNPEYPDKVIIKTSSLKAISFQGELIIDSVGNKYKNSVSRYYSPFKITVKGFKSDQLNLHGSDGGGDLVLTNNIIKDLSLNIGELSNVRIDSTNHFGLLNVQSSKNPSITLDGAHVKSLKTNLGPSGSLILKGNNIESMTTYK